MLWYCKHVSNILPSCSATRCKLFLHHRMKRENACRGAAADELVVRLVQGICQVSFNWALRCWHALK